MSTETTLWKGSPSQLKNLGYFLLCGLFFFLVFPLFLLFWRWLQTRCTHYELTTERFIFARGVLNKTTDQLELYRVRDYRFEQPLLLRLFGLGNVVLVATDRTSHIQLMVAVKDGASLIAQARQQVEDLRRRKTRII